MNSNSNSNPVVHEHHIHLLDSLTKLENDRSRLHSKIQLQKQKLQDMHEKDTELETSIDNLVNELHNSGIDLEKYKSRFETQPCPMDEEPVNLSSISKHELYSLIENVLNNTIQRTPSLRSHASQEPSQDTSKESEELSSLLFKPSVPSTSKSVSDNQSDISSSYVFHPPSKQNSFISPISCPTPSLSLREDN